MAAEPGAPSAVEAEPSALLRLHSCEVPDDWIDYNGHVTEFRYLQVCADATDALLAHLGMDGGYLAAGGSYYTVESHICHLGQLYGGDRVEAITQVLGWDDKRLHVYHVVVRAGEAEPVATGEHMLVHVDTAADRAAPVRDPVRANVAAAADAHAGLPRPARAGRRLSL